MPTVRRENKLLTSWKEIAAHFGKGVRTVQRWEQQFGLPVSRPKNARRGVVIASPDELDRWLASNWSHQPGGNHLAVPTDGSDGVAASIRDYRLLRQATRALMFDLTRAMEGLHGESEELARNLTRPTGTETRVTEKRKPSVASSPIRRRDTR